MTEDSSRFNMTDKGIIAIILLIISIWMIYYSATTHYDSITVLKDRYGNVISSSTSPENERVRMIGIGGWLLFLGTIAWVIRAASMTNKSEIPDSDYIPDNEVTDYEVVCPYCIKPLDQTAYYCTNCGKGTTHNNPYLPFIKIQFEADFFGKIWDKLWDKETSRYYKFFCWALILVTFPIIVIIGIGSRIWEKKKKKRISIDEAREEYNKWFEKMKVKCGKLPLDEFEQFLKKTSKADLNKLQPYVSKKSHPDQFKMLIEEIRKRS